MINERKFSNEKDEKRDLLSNLIDANEELLEDGEQRLGEVELIGTGLALCLLTHLFTHLFREYFHVLHRWARGEGTLTNMGRRLISVVLQTSGHTLCFVLNMLAVYQEEQEVLYQHIQDVLPDDRLPVSAQDIQPLGYEILLHQ